MAWLRHCKRTRLKFQRRCLTTAKDEAEEEVAELVLAEQAVVAPRNDGRHISSACSHMLYTPFRGLVGDGKGWLPLMRFTTIAVMPDSTLYFLCGGIWSPLTARKANPQPHVL